MPRIVICGGPRVGKTSLAQRLAQESGLPVVSTDNFIGVPWGSVPETVILSVKYAEDWILEGIQATRVLRKWLQTAPLEARITVVHYLKTPVVARTKKQDSTAKAVASVLDSIRRDLQTLRIPVIEHG